MRDIAIILCFLISVTAIGIARKADKDLEEEKSKWKVDKIHYTQDGFILSTDKVSSPQNLEDQITDLNEAINSLTEALNLKYVPEERNLVKAHYEYVGPVKLDKDSSKTSFVEMDGNKIDGESTLLFTRGTIPYSNTKSKD